MKKFVSLGLAIALLAGVAGSASASMLKVGDRVQFYDREGTSNGGAFGIRLKQFANPGFGDSNTTATDLFRTFCVEKNEYIDFNSRGFVVDSISKSANGGGVGGGNPDPLSDKTSWLYYNFRKGTLAGYNGTDGAANKLQEAIWFLENEISLTATQQANNAFLVAANAASLSDLTFAGTRVFVMNLKWATDRSGFDGVWEYNSINGWFRDGGDNGQSQLYMIPEPGSLAIWGLIGMGCAVAAGRRRRLV